MSRVGKYPVEIPAGVQVALAGDIITVKGRLGELSLPLSTDKVDTKVEGMVLELDGDGRPQGWQNGHGTVPTEGSWTQEDNLRTVTDLVILSPAGAAVRVDAEGRADGLVRHGALAEHIRQRQLSRADAAGRGDA